jgi:hypothetical protein
LIEEFPLNINPQKDNYFIPISECFQGEFQFFLKDKFPKTLKEAQDFASQIENNLDSCELHDPPMASALEEKIMNLALSHKTLMTKVNALDENVPLTN